MGTPHCLREIKDGKSALDMFVADLVNTHAKVETTYSPLAKMFPENALPAFLLAGGNEDIWAMGLLRSPGMFRNFMSLVLRRLYSAILDSGVACSNKHNAPVKELAKRSLFSLLLTILLIFKLRRRHTNKGLR